MARPCFAVSRGLPPPAIREKSANCLIAKSVVLDHPAMRELNAERGCVAGLSRQQFVDATPRALPARGSAHAGAGRSRWRAARAGARPAHGSDGIAASCAPARGAAGCAHGGPIHQDIKLANISAALIGLLNHSQTTWSVGSNSAASPSGFDCALHLAVMRFGSPRQSAC
jgi:hypothetical protein